MTKSFTILCLLFIFNSCIENKEQPIHRYISNPDRTDTLCISEINRAKNEVKKNGIAFTQEVGFIYGNHRYEKELKNLIEQKGLKYEVDLVSDFVVEGQTQGCYGAYMDKMLDEKYGKGFKQQMHKMADSLFLENVIKSNAAVDYIDVDERPKLPSEKSRSSDYISEVLVYNLDIKEDKSEYGGWPFFDVGFIVEKDSTINSFDINYFFEGLESNKKYRNELFELAKKHLIENYPTWIPGRISGTPVRTDNNVRIYLVKE